jgi:hypothetical protein
LQALNKIYRTNYGGERITTEASLSGSLWQYKTEWIPTAVSNNQISKTACVIGNGASRSAFPTETLIGHLAGRLGAKSLQTYGCNALYRDLNPTFLVATGNDICDEIANSGYCDDHIVYANSDKIIKYPGKFYLVPQDFMSNAGAIATYLACFDGHEKIYMLSFDGQAGDNYNNNMYAGTNAYGPADQHYTDTYWIKSQLMVMATYSDVEFVRVCTTNSWKCPPEWSALDNFRQISFREFVLEADLGTT